MRYSFILFSLLAIVDPAQATDQKRIDDLVAKVTADLKNNRAEHAAISCAQALEIDRFNPTALSCVDLVKAAAVAAVESAQAAAGIGRAGEAVAWCRAVLTVDPTSTALVSKCTPLEDKWLKYTKGQLDLERARAYAQAGDTDNALKTLTSDNIKNSESPETFNASIALMRKIGANNPAPGIQLGLAYAGLSLAADAETACKPLLGSDPANALDCMKKAAKLRHDATIQKESAALDVAEAQISDGNLTDARTAAKAVLESTMDGKNKDRATELIKKTKTSFLATFARGMRSAWIGSMAAAIVLIVGVLAVLFTARATWRRAVKFRAVRSGSQRWSFGAIQDDAKLGAKDPILDALRRMPNEVRAPIWTPTRLWLDIPEGQTFCQVVEDIDVDKENRVKPLYENVFEVAFTTGLAGDAALLDAFQNVQFSVGPANVNIAVKLVRAVFDWWHDGAPTLSGVVQQVPAVDITPDPNAPVATANTAKQIAVRLTCSNSMETISTLATTTADPGMDALRVSAERAAYKLALSLLPSTKPDTAEQIDAHAAFRQGAKSLSIQVKTVADQATDQIRAAELNTAVTNLEFARQVFARDADHEKYYLESVRLQAVAYAMLGRDAAAFQRFEELEIGATGSKDFRADSRYRDLAVEALYNQALLHLKAATSGNSATSGQRDYSELDLAGPLLDRVIAMAPGTIAAHAAAVQKVRIYGAVERKDWHILADTRDEIEAAIAEAQKLPAVFDHEASKAVGADRRFLTSAATRVRRSYAIAQLMYVYNFEARGRGPFEICADPLPHQLRKAIRSAVDCFFRTNTLANPPIEVLLNWAYGLLLLGKYRQAQRYAAQVLGAHPEIEFAIYVAAEASLQRGDRNTAITYIRTAGASPTDPSLCALIRDLGPFEAIEVQEVKTQAAAG
jgi:tetratricopeptide (TPR) repeat protein